MNIKIEVQKELLSKLNEDIDNEIEQMKDSYTVAEIAQEVIYNIKNSAYNSGKCICNNELTRIPKKIGIVNVNLQYEIPYGIDEEEFLENVALPKEYVEDSFEIIKVMKEDE